jgi:hypothetical protein
MHRRLPAARVADQMRAVECNAFRVSAIAIRPVNVSKPPAAIRQNASTICLSKRKVRHAARKSGFL